MWKAYECLKDEGSSHLTVNHSLNFEDPITGGESNMPRTGTAKDLFKRDLQEWLWRKHYGDDPFGNINIV